MSDAPGSGPNGSAAPRGDLLAAELSLLRFQWRVLALAEDPATPLLERLRFLGIVTSNLDEFYMVRMADLRHDAASARRDAFTSTGHGHGPDQLLFAVEREIALLLTAQARCAGQCLRDVDARGVRLVSWAALTGDQRQALERRYLDDLHRDLTPMAITLAPGHAVPHLPHLGLFVAVAHRARDGDRAHLAEHELPRDVPRFFPVPGRPGAVIPLEEVLRANVHHLHPGAVIDGAWLFRVTRGGHLPADADDPDDPVAAVARAVERRPYNPAVRVEVEPGMPLDVANKIVEGLRREAAPDDLAATVDAPQQVEGLLDLRALAELPLPDVPAMRYPPLQATSPLGADASLFARIAGADLLVHHPFDGFDHTVVRFVADAAADPQVESIAITLYRVGDPAPVVDALLAAARAGKQVLAVVELRARFDEVHNVHWARALEQAGGRVVYGVPGFKVHAKATLVERRESGALVRYAHVGTGNYNTRTGRQYTDLSLFSARSGLTADLRRVFDALADSTVPQGPFAGGTLVAPHTMRIGLLRRIAREGAHAARGRPASIRAKLNGLADTEVVRALYAASQAGVEIDLVVRGICTLRPGVPGLSERIRVVSVLGRFLEHSRIYRFANDGDPEYFIGSADWRARNLRRRVELLVEVPGAPERATLDAVLDRYLGWPDAWTLTSAGAYIRSLHGEQS